MANKKFSEFELKTTTSNVSHIVGYNGAENVRITPANFISGSGGPFLPLAGGIMVGNTTHNDNVKSIYGTSGDGLQIYHDGSNSYIVDSGTGGLNLLANSDFAVKSYGTDEPFISAATNAFVKLFFDGSEKLATTSTGISVTGKGTFSEDVIADTHFNSSDTNVTLSTSGAGNVFLRPNGKSDTTGQVLVNQSGELKIDSDDATLILKGSDTGSSLINFSDASDGNVGRIFYDHQNNFMQFKTNDSERMRLDSLGNLGLGTSTPLSFGAGSHLVTAQGDAGNNYGGFIARTDNVTGQMWATEGGANVVIGSRTDHPVLFSIFNTEKMRLTSIGDLLIGTTTGNVFNRTTANDGGVSMMATSSGVRIDAARDGVCYTGNRPSTDGILFDIRRSGVTVGAISVTETATTYSTASDYRLKEDLQDFKGLDLVSKIPVYDYKWKADESRSYGVMAHELEEVLPQAVSGEKDAEEMQSVDYSKIVPLLVKSIQELSAKLEALECQCEKK